VKEVFIDALLVIGVGVQVLSCVGVWLMRDVYQRLHYSAAATTLGPVAIATAVVLREALSEAGIESVLTGVVLLTGGALLTHATGRAARIGEHDGWDILPDEVEQPVERVRP
jgi:monovalent cation/proton antiporter MnhG/PhaG subunit